MLKSAPTFLVAIFIIAIPGWVPDTRAQEKKFLFRISGGPLFMTINNFSEYINNVAVPGLFYFSSDISNVGREIAFDFEYKLGRHHSLTTRIENSLLSATRSIKFFDLRLFEDRIELNFYTTSISLSLESSFKWWENRISHKIGFGSSLQYSSLYSGVNDSGKRKKQSDYGYGFHVYGATEYNIYGALLLNARIRARSADGISFRDRTKIINLDYYGLDILFGFGWKM